MASRWPRAARWARRPRSLGRRAHVRERQIEDDGVADRDLSDAVPRPPRVRRPARAISGAARAAAAARRAATAARSPLAAACAGGRRRRGRARAAGRVASARRGRLAANRVASSHTRSLRRWRRPLLRRRRRRRRGAAPAARAARRAEHGPQKRRLHARQRWRRSSAVKTRAHRAHAVLSTPASARAKPRHSHALSSPSASRSRYTVAPSTPRWRTTISPRPSTAWRSTLPSAKRTVTCSSRSQYGEVQPRAAASSAPYRHSSPRRVSSLSAAPTHCSRSDAHATSMR